MMYGQYHHYQQQRPAMAAAATAVQGALQWNGAAWVSATAAAAVAGHVAGSTAKFGADQAASSAANVVPPNPVATFTQYYHAYQAQVNKYEELIRRSGPSPLWQSRLDWAKYYMNESTRAAHHFYNNPVDRSAPFPLPPAPAPASEDSDDTAANAVTVASSISSTSTMTDATATPEAVAARTDENTPGGLERFFQKCLGLCATDEQKKSMQAKVELAIARAIQDGSLHSKNWDAEPIPRLETQSSRSRASDGNSASNVLPQQNQSSPSSDRRPSGMDPGAPSRTSSQSKPSRADFDYVNSSYYDGSGVPTRTQHRASPTLTLTSSYGNSPPSPYGANSSLSSLSQNQRSGNHKHKRKCNSYYGPADDDTTLIGADFIALPRNGKKAKKQKKVNSRSSSAIEKGMNNLSSTLSKRANRFSGPGGIADAISSEAAIDVSESNKYMGKSLIGGSIKKLDEQDFEQMTVKGTCLILEKEYLRLTSPPRAELVRPQPVLERHLANIKSLMLPSSAITKDYLWFCSQLKAIRQDCTVQRIRNEFTIDVYETHAKIALEEGDLNEYNQCQTQLKYLYADGTISKIPGACRNYEEFVAYRILYYVFLSTNDSYDGGSSDFVNIMLSLTPEQHRHDGISHALSVREAVALGNYHRFFRLHASCPNSGRCLTQYIVPTIRYRALQRISKSYRPLVDVDFCLKELDFGTDAAGGHAWLKSCGCVIDGNKFLTKDSTTIHEPILDKKNSLI